MRMLHEGAYSQYRRTALRVTQTIQSIILRVPDKNARDVKSEYFSETVYDIILPCSTKYEHPLESGVQYLYQYKWWSIKINCWRYAF
jgi:hypothetical protein